MKILFEGVGKAQNVTKTPERGIKFTTRVKTDFGKDPVTIELVANSIIALIEKFGIQKANTKTSSTIMESLTDANEARLMGVIKRKVVSLEIK